jgi:two-component system, chemotaxis family, chemotaxis protein CheY
MKDCSVLIAEDSPETRQLVCEIIKKRLGFNTIHEAGDGTEALAILNNHRIDIIVADWNMPNLSGDKLLYEVRNNKEWANIPFIMMTAHKEREFIVNAVQLGVNQYLVKPFTSRDLEEKVRKSLDHSIKRQAQRYADLPKHFLTIRIGKKSFPGEVENISRSGMLINLDYDDEFRLFGTYEFSLTVEKPDRKDLWVINPLFGKAVRFESKGMINGRSLPCLMAIQFEHALLDKTAEKNLSDLLEWLDAQCPSVIPEC